MSWQTPIYNRTIDSTYEYTDPNRVNDNTIFLRDYINTNVGYNITLSTYTTQSLTTLPTLDLINILEYNINTLKNVVGTPLEWENLLENWSITNDVFLYNNANNLEQNLYNLKLMLENIVASYRVCGYYNCGTDWEL